jgi:hypothetical protein
LVQAAAGNTRTIMSAEKSSDTAKPAGTKRDWTPVRNGDAYCSPACGGGPRVCSIERYKHAVKVADATARDLGAGWTPVVKENLGWHARVVSPCGRISVHLPVLPDDTGYTAFLGPKEFQPAGKWAESGRTPREAIENVLNAARRDLGLIEKTIKGLEIPVARRGKRIAS